jgi:hypothetical protein
MEGRRYITKTFHELRTFVSGCDKRPKVSQTTTRKVRRIKKKKQNQFFERIRGCKTART